MSTIQPLDSEQPSKLNLRPDQSMVDLEIIPPSGLLPPVLENWGEEEIPEIVEAIDVVPQRRAPVVFLPSVRKSNPLSKLPVLQGQHGPPFFAEFARRFENKFCNETPHFLAHKKEFEKCLAECNLKPVSEIHAHIDHHHSSVHVPDL